MIFGKTQEQKHAEAQSKAKALAFGVKKFAFIPVTLVDGRSVWLEHYYEYSTSQYAFDKYENWHDENRKHLTHSLRHVIIYDYANDHRVMDEDKLKKLMENDTL